MTDKEMALAIENCNSAPIHTPGFIQPYAAILGIDADSKKIAFFSENLEEFLDIDMEHPENIDVLKLFFDDNGMAAALLSKLPAVPHYFSVNILGNQYMVKGFSFERFLVLEFEACPLGVAEFSHLMFMNSSLSIFRDSNDLDEIFSLLLDRIREYTGFDRVMLYKFDENYDGEVIAESKSAQIGSFYGHRFPSTDIPQNARELYAKNPVRLISDIKAQNIKVVWCDGYDSVPIDLSFANSRAVAPLHVEYLANMSVRGSMSISLTINKRLWGLIACHHNDALYLPFIKRLWCEELSKILSGVIDSREKAELAYKTSQQNGAMTELTRLLSLGTANLYKKSFFELSKIFYALVEADGLALVDGGKNISKNGQTPSDEQILKLVEFLSDRCDKDGVFSTDKILSLGFEFEKYAKKAAGVLFVRLGDGCVLWFRGEKRRTIAWAGQPIKRFYNENGEPRLSPRNSFESWYEERAGECVVWSENELFFASKFARLFGEFLEIENEKSKKYSGPENNGTIEQVVELMPEAVIVTDIDGYIVFVNDAFCKMTKYNKAKVIGESVSILKSTKHERAFYAELWSTILAKKIWSGKITNRAADGVLYKVNATIAPILNEQGDIVNFVAIEHEITDISLELEMDRAYIMQMEEALKRKEEERSEAELISLSNLKFKIKKELLSQVAHHWRNPLNIISIMLQDIVFAYKDGALNDEYIESFKSKTMDIVQKMSGVISNFADYFKPDDESAAFDARAVIEETVNALMPNFVDRGIKVELNAPECECIINGHKSALRAVTMELLDNAAEIASSRAIQDAFVWISVYMQDGIVVMEFVDNCGGIENIEAIFEPYNSTKGVKSGIGLGLFEVRVLAEKYLNAGIEASNWTLGAKFVLKTKSGS